MKTILLKQDLYRNDITSCYGSHNFDWLSTSNLNIADDSKSICGLGSNLKYCAAKVSFISDNQKFKAHKLERLGNNSEGTQQKRHINFFVSDLFSKVIVHEGWIIDGISIDEELFGKSHANQKEIILGSDEKVFAIDYSLYDGTSFTETNLDDTICRLTIKTNYDSYGPYSVPRLGCEEKVESIIVPSYLSLKDVFETYSTTTKNEGFFTFTPDVPNGNHQLPMTTSISTTAGTILTVTIRNGV